MKTKMEQFPATNPALNVGKDGTVLYSNVASEPLLNKWEAKIGDKLPSYIRDIVQRVISRNNPEKMEVKVGNKVYLVVFHPLPEQECVNVSGFNISDQKEIEEKLKDNEERLTAFMDNSPSIAWMKDEQGRIVYLSKSYENRFNVRLEDWLGKTDFELWPLNVAEQFQENDLSVLNGDQTIEVVEETTNQEGSPTFWWNFKFLF